MCEHSHGIIIMMDQPMGGHNHVARGTDRIGSRSRHRRWVGARMGNYVHARARVIRAAKDRKAGGGRTALSPVITEWPLVLSRITRTGVNHETRV